MHIGRARLNDFPYVSVTLWNYPAKESLQMLPPEKQRKTAISVLSMLFVLITVLIFIRPEFAFAFALSTHSMTESCLTKLVDVTDEDTFSKVADVVTLIENDVLENFDGRIVATSISADCNFVIL